MLFASKKPWTSSGRQPVRVIYNCLREDGACAGARLAVLPPPADHAGYHPHPYSCLQHLHHPQHQQQQATRCCGPALLKLTLVMTVLCLLLCVTLLSYTSCCRGVTLALSRARDGQALALTDEEADVPDYDLVDYHRHHPSSPLSPDEHHSEGNHHHQQHHKQRDHDGKPHHQHHNHKHRRKGSAEEEDTASSSSSSSHTYHSNYLNYSSDVQPTRRLPDAIIIGVKKAGTRALLEFLKLHPSIRAAGPEPHFFDRNYQRGLDWYRSQMPTTLPGQLTMEKTPSYFIRSEVPGRVLNMSRAVKLVVVVRDPVVRAVSDYTQTAAKKRGAMRSFTELAFAGNGSRVVDTSWSAIKIGVYARYLHHWLQYFPLSQIHFVNGERLVADPAAEMALLQDFLGLRRIVKDKHFYFNDTKGFPCLLKAEGSGRPHCLNKNKGREHPHIADDVIQRLRDFYRPFNHKFYQMTGIDFGWL